MSSPQIQNWRILSRYCHLLISLLAESLWLWQLWFWASTDKIRQEVHLTKRCFNGAYFCHIVPHSYFIFVFRTLVCLFLENCDIHPLSSLLSCSRQVKFKLRTVKDKGLYSLVTIPFKSQSSDSSVLHFLPMWMARWLQFRQHRDMRSFTKLLLEIWPRLTSKIQS